MTGLRCHQLRYRRPDSSAGDAADVLSGIDARFEPGTLSLVSGPTGAGKSTLLHLLAGLLRPTAGEVQWLGQTVSRWHSSHKDRWRRQVGIVFQHQRLLGDLTAGENVLLPLIPRRMPIRAQYTAVADALGRVDLATKAASPAARLSGGERQRLSLARASSFGSIWVAPHTSRGSSRRPRSPKSDSFAGPAPSSRKTKSCHRYGSANSNPHRAREAAQLG